MRICRQFSVLVVAFSIEVFMPNVRSVRAQSMAADWEKSAGASLALHTASVQLEPSPGTAPKCWGTGPLGPLSNDGTGTGGLAFGYSDCSVSDYIELAYKLWLAPGQRQSLLVQLPGWAVTDRFNIRLKGPGDATKDQKRVTMQSLLADRFKLSVHFETREMPVFALIPLIPGETGPKLQPHPDGVPCPTAPVGHLGPEGIPALCGIFGGGPGDGRASIGGRDVTMAQIAKALTQQGSGVDRPVLDQTGFTGNYDFVIVFTPPISQQYTEQIGGPAFEQALRDQLGLKLQTTTGPVDVLVIDHIEEPTLN